MACRIMGAMNTLIELWGEVRTWRSLPAIVVWVLAGLAALALLPLARQLAELHA